VSDYEVKTRNHLLEVIKELNDLEEALTATAREGARRAPAQLKEIMKYLSEALQECEQIVDQHASDTLRVSDDLLLMTANTMAAIHEVMSAIVLVEAMRKIQPAG
jgi:hypothetical protein